MRKFILVTLFFAIFNGNVQAKDYVCKYDNSLCIVSLESDGKYGGTCVLDDKFDIALKDARAGKCTYLPKPPKAIDVDYTKNPPTAQLSY